MGETEEDGAKPLRQPKKDGSQKPIRQAESEIPVFALFAILANMDPRTMSELIAKKKRMYVRTRLATCLRVSGWPPSPEIRTALHTDLTSTA